LYPQNREIPFLSDSPPMSIRYLLDFIGATIVDSAAFFFTGTGKDEEIPRVLRPGGPHAFKRDDACRKNR
jgi:hypothetical protein